MAVDEYALFDAIIARKTLKKIREIVENRPQSVQEKPPSRRPSWRIEWTSGSTALHVAVQQRALPDEALRFIYHCHPPNLLERDGSGRIPLHYLDKNELPLETIQYFVLEWPESLQQEDDVGDLVLHVAVTNRNLSMESIRFLIEQNPASVRERGHGGMTTLMYALKSGVASIDRILYLLEQLPESIQERDDDGNLPIHTAASNKELPLVQFRLLVEHWPDSVRERDANDRLPLHLVAGRDGFTGHEHTFGIVRYLSEMHPESIEAGNGNNNLAVHEAILSQAPHEVIRLLVLRYPKCLMVWSGTGDLALHMAVICGASFETITFLFEQHPQAVREVERGGGYGRIALQRAAGTREPSLATLRLLLAGWPESVLFQNLAGQTALHICVNEDGIAEDSEVFEAVQLLVEAGPGALQVRDDQGKLPLHILLSRRNPDLPVVRCLVEAYPKSVLVPTRDAGYALFVAAATAGVKLDVLYYLVRQWPGHYFVRHR